MSSQKAALLNIPFWSYLESQVAVLPPYFQCILVHVVET